MTGDLIDSFCDYASAAPSAEIFREWCGITLVAGALERRVWTRIRAGTSFPNLFVMLIGPPAAGKGVINYVSKIWRETKDGEKPAFHIGRDSYTSASLRDDLDKCVKTIVPATGPPFQYHSILLASEEFGVLFPRFDPEFLGTLTDLWNAKDSYTESRRTSAVKKLDISNPIVTMLAGYQPSLMASNFPTQAWEQGFMRRVIMVWNGRSERKSLLGDILDQDTAPPEICKRLTQLARLYGPFKWEQEAFTKLDAWHLAEGPPRPLHTRLQYYAESRTQMIIKLAMIAACSESPELIVRMRHLDRAFDWLFRVERLMPDVFRAMLGDSDKNLQDELYNFMLAQYAKKRQVIPGQMIYLFMRDKAPSHKVDAIVNLMERAGMIQRDAGTDLWRPVAGKDRLE